MPDLIAANVGADKDSEKRQRAAIEGFAKRAGLEIVDWFYDPAVSGADPIEVRPGFSALLDRIEGNGVLTVVVEDASRFAREVRKYQVIKMAAQHGGFRKGAGRPKGSRNQATIAGEARQREALATVRAENANLSAIDDD